MRFSYPKDIESLVFRIPQDRQDVVPGSTQWTNIVL